MGAVSKAADTVLTSDRGAGWLRRTQCRRAVRGDLATGAVKRLLKDFPPPFDRTVVHAAPSILRWNTVYSPPSASARSRKQHLQRTGGVVARYQGVSEGSGYVEIEREGRRRVVGLTCYEPMNSRRRMGCQPIRTSSTSCRDGFGLPLPLTMAQPTIQPAAIWGMWVDG
jgi:hypothetical protein